MGLYFKITGYHNGINKNNPYFNLIKFGRNNDAFVKHYFLLGHHNDVIYYLNTPLGIPCFKTQLKTLEYFKIIKTIKSQSIKTKLIT